MQKSSISSPDAYVLADSHDIIAILPIRFYRCKQKSGCRSNEGAAKTESINFQKKCTPGCCGEKMQGKIRPEIQDIETTNATLKNAG
ncbi:MAG: hypothetical protein R3C61_16065 [Bacteroidia bacterium]